MSSLSAFTQQGSMFAEEILKYVDKIGRQSTLGILLFLFILFFYMLHFFYSCDPTAPSLVYFGNTIVATMSVQEQMVFPLSPLFTPHIMTHMV